MLLKDSIVYILILSNFIKISTELCDFKGSLFAYGQTGSGKSYSMVGYGANKWIINFKFNLI